MKIENPTVGTLDDILIAMEFALSGILKLRVAKGRFLRTNRKMRDSAEDGHCPGRIPIYADYVLKSWLNICRKGIDLNTP